MEQITKGPIQPLRLGPDSRFQFRCHKDVKCFTQCCRGINIILTPYDIIGLKHRLGLSWGIFSRSTPSCRCSRKPTSRWSS